MATRHNSKRRPLFSSESSDSSDDVGAAAVEGGAAACDVKGWSTGRLRPRDRRRRPRKRRRLLRGDRRSSSDSEDEEASKGSEDDAPDRGYEFLDEEACEESGEESASSSSEDDDAVDSANDFYAFPQGIPKALPLGGGCYGVVVGPDPIHGTDGGYVVRVMIGKESAIAASHRGPLPGKGGAGSRVSPLQEAEQEEALSAYTCVYDTDKYLLITQELAEGMLPRARGVMTMQQVHDDDYSSYKSSIGDEPIVVQLNGHPILCRVDFIYSCNLDDTLIPGYGEEDQESDRLQQASEDPRPEYPGLVAFLLQRKQLTTETSVTHYPFLNPVMAIVERGTIGHTYNEAGKELMNDALEGCAFELADLGGAHKETCVACQLPRWCKSSLIKDDVTIGPVGSNCAKRLLAVEKLAAALEPRPAGVFENGAVGKAALLWAADHAIEAVGELVSMWCGPV